MCREGMILVALIGAVWVSACTPGISKQARSQVSYNGGFGELQQQPDKYEGETVIWGGRIIDIQIQEGVTEMVVLQLALSGGDWPRDDDRSKGRFLVRTSQFLDPALFPKGTIVTVVGRVLGAERRMIGEMAYNYPVIDVVEIKKWPSGTAPATRFHFGISVGTHF